MSTEAALDNRQQSVKNAFILGHFALIECELCAGQTESGIWHWHPRRRNQMVFNYFFKFIIFVATRDPRESPPRAHVARK